MQLAELNIAQAKTAMDDPVMKDFVDNLDPVNAMAEASPGFVWRLKDDSGNATDIQVFDDPNLLVNLSVWDSVESLKTFMFKTHHLNIMKRRSEWFEKPKTHTYVMWWVEDGHIPSLQEAVERLEYLREHGDSAHAFTFADIFSPPA
ncbi:DUF3291 domain-containing protein [Enterovibrio calviensis]|uniref:DUF3291 domain-containing protein n=1 Tax=Enterovibrio calviensis TaxID=91359 RepID=UPI00048975FA|nr:DUF3291 domain-containing protein [Enterovibrio calviensis]